MKENEKEKKFCGNAVERSSLSTKINLNQIFRHLYEENGNEKLLDIFKEFKKVLDEEQPKFINVWQDQHKKNQYDLKITIKKKNDSKNFNTHYAELDEWQPEKKTEEEETQEPKGDDLPF